MCFTNIYCKNERGKIDAAGMSTLLPLQTGLPSWLETGASAEVFEAGVVGLGLGLEEAGTVLDNASPDALTTAYLGALIEARRNPHLARENLRQLLSGIANHPQTASVFAAAVQRARAQTQTGWVAQTRRRFASDIGDVFLFSRETSPSVRMAVVKLGPAGHLYFNKKVRARFLSRRNEWVVVRLLGDVIAGVDCVKDGLPGPKPQLELALIYQDGKPVDSIFGSFFTQRMTDLQNAVVKTYLNQGGGLVLGGRVWSQSAKYGHYPVEAEIRNGVVVEVRVLKPSASLYLASEPVVDGTKEFSLVFDKDRRLVNSFLAFSPKDFRALTEHTVVMRLSHTMGFLNIGNRTRGSFPEHAGKIVAVRIRQGQITQVLFLNAARIKDVDVAELSPSSPLVQKAYDYSLIYDGEGKLTGSYYKRLRGKKLPLLKNNVVITSMDKHGILYIGAYRVRCARYPKHVAAAHIQDGVIAKVVVLRARRISETSWPLKNPEDALGEIPLRLAWDAKGRLVDSFQNFPGRLRRHIGKITGNFRVNIFNRFLYRGTHYYFGDDVDYRGWPLSEIVFGDPLHLGEITEFAIKNPETKETMRLDARQRRQNLGDVADWVIEKIPPAPGEKAIGGKRPRSVLRIGPTSPSPEETLLREEQIARVRRALQEFNEEEQELLLEAAMLYYELRRKELPGKVHMFWFVEEIQDELDTLDIIAEQLEVPREWIIRSFETLRKSLESR